MFPGSQLFAFLPVAQGILGALLWPCWKYLNPSYIFTQSTAALRKGWCSVQKTSLTCKRDSKTSCEVICGEVMRCQNVHMDLFEEERVFTNSRQFWRYAAHMIIQRSCLFFRFLPGVALGLSCSLKSSQSAAPWKCYVSSRRRK